MVWGTASAFWTDGSRSYEGTTGAACVWSDPEDGTLKRSLYGMERGQEAYDRELMAILLALREANKQRQGGLL
jgi:hypothetical protein